MPTNKNNNEVGKSFAIGTKIEYMNKLFKVTESNQCCDCSLATICSSSDISAGDRKYDALSATDVYYGNPVFKNEADVKYVIDNPNFREVLDKIFKV